MKSKVGDWVILDMEIGQFEKVIDEDCVSFSTGFINTSGSIAERFRPLTLRNKRIAETFDALYKRLNKIDGEAGFNYPDIHRYFSQLTLQAIDGKDNERMFDKATEFVQAAKDYTPIIDGVRLFRRR